MERLLTGIALGAVVLLLILWAGPALFVVILTGFILATQSEYYDLFREQPEKAKRPVGLLFSAVLSLSFYWGLASAAEVRVTTRGSAEAPSKGIASLQAAINE